MRLDKKTGVRVMILGRELIMTWSRQMHTQERSNYIAMRYCDGLFYIDQRISILQNLKNRKRRSTLHSRDSRLIVRQKGALFLFNSSCFLNALFFYAD